MDVLTTLREEHRQMERLLEQCHSKQMDYRGIKELVKEFTDNFTVHAELEEKYVYPAIRSVAPGADPVLKAYE
ncbi:MAG: hemerythrin domain-containing protein, partial [Cyanobacteria bacterium NC_groundwater_1444_Ag_S-0.65um_54_12]|nr:hemerythrin domain-containing protein [Cyanobacteria bacterium NC_groundwater_1444_Ag_S-0.65um_54_12]